MISRTRVASCNLMVVSINLVGYLHDNFSELQQHSSPNDVSNGSIAKMEQFCRRTEWQS